MLPLYGMKLDKGVNKAEYRKKLENGTVLHQNIQKSQGFETCCKC